jgi:hypothetical protein
MSVPSPEGAPPDPPSPEPAGSSGSDAAAAASTPASPPAVRIPSLSRRVTIGSLRLVAAFALFAGIPYTLLRLAPSEVSVAFSLGVVFGVGLLLATVGALKYIARPTKLFGPISAAGSALAIVYLLYLSSRATISVQIMDQGGLAIDFGRVLFYGAVVPALGLLAAAVITAEDLARPGERVAYEFAAKE